MAPFLQMICTWQKNWRGLDFFLDLSWKLSSNSQNKTNNQPLDVFVMPESLPLLTQKKELETFSMLIHWFKISNHGITILQWDSVLGSCILTIFAFILLWGTSCKGQRAWTNSLWTEIQPKKKANSRYRKSGRCQTPDDCAIYGVIFNMPGLPFLH